jgi:hypothetical protein
MRDPSAAGEVEMVGGLGGLEMIEEVEGAETIAGVAGVCTKSNGGFGISVAI